MNIRYRVDLSEDERRRLTSLLSGGQHGSRQLKRAQILLAADAGASDDEIERCVGTSGSTIYRTKRRFVEGNLEAALSERARTGAARKLTGKDEEALPLPPPVPGRPRAASAGPWSCWPTRWSGVPNTTRCRARLCAGG